MNDLLLQLLAEAGDGLVVFDQVGKVLYSNLDQQTAREVFEHGQIADRNILDEISSLPEDGSELRKGVNVGNPEASQNENNATLISLDSLFALYIRNAKEKLRFNTLRSNLLNLINHELRTPMNGVIGGVSALSSMLADARSDRETFDLLAKTTTDSALDLMKKMNSLLDLAQLYGGETIKSEDRIILSEIVSAAAKALGPECAEKKITVKIAENGEMIGVVYGSSIWLQRAIQECLRNSIEHSTNGSEVHVIISQTSGNASIVLRDYGRGLSPDVKSTVFEPFTGGGDKDNFSNQGLGIGLSLAEWVVESHGGLIEIRDRSEGAEVYIEVPSGAPLLQNTEEADLLQAQFYARDLARLMKQHSSEKKKVDAA